MKMCYKNDMIVKIVMEVTIEKEKLFLSLKRNVEEVEKNIISVLVDRSIIDYETNFKISWW